VEDFHDDDGIEGKGARKIDRIVALECITEHAVGASKEQQGHQHDMPDQRGAEQAFVARTWRTAHRRGFGGLEGQRDAQCHFGDEVDPQHLDRNHRQR
jgi:hypothetical protein